MISAYTNNHISFASRDTKLNPDQHKQIIDSLALKMRLHRDTKLEYYDKEQ